MASFSGSWQADAAEASNLIQMKGLDRQIVGFLLIGLAILARAVIQWLGPCLIVIKQLPPPPPAVTPTVTGNRLILVTSVQMTSYHFALLPLVVVGIVGFV